MPSAERDEPVERALLLVGSIALAFVIVRLAWVCDDAFITLRTVDQFVGGNGLVWNLGERVQAYTHPLWLCLITPFYFVTREPFYTLIGLSCALSFAALWLIVRRCACSVVSALVVIALLIGSKAFVDYSTSGLENALTHLLLVLFASQYLGASAITRRKLSVLVLLAALGAVNRLDTLLIYLPCIADAFARAPRGRRIATVAVGFAPLWLWEAFSLFYYGFLFPNTAYAKLGAGIARGELLHQGFAYFANSLAVDPLTLCAIALGCALAWLRRERTERLLCLGAVLYLVYVVSIGGDFMSGRLLTAPLVCAVLVIARQPLPGGLAGLAVPALVFALGIVSPRAPLRIDGSDPQREPLVDVRGVCDERAFYMPTASLLAGARTLPAPRHNARRGAPAAEREVLTIANIGFKGYYAPNDTYIIDVFALSDPLLARLPMKYQPDWRIGHYPRWIPEGYVETLQQGRTLLADARLAAYHEALMPIVRGPLFSRERLMRIVRFQLGAYDGPIAERWDEYRFPLQREVGAADVSTAFAEGTPNDAAGVQTLGDGEALTIRLAQPSHAARAVVSVDYNDNYDVIFVRDGRVLGVERIGIRNIRGRDPGLRAGSVAVPRAAREPGFDTVRIFPWAGDSHYAVGQLQLLD